jgi:2-phosphosulfolactate phosphatase
MNARLSVHLLPDLVSEADLAGGTVVVIDVLRASTTIVHALAAGAVRVVPCVDIDEARRIAADLPAGQAVLGGERGGLAIEGFHLGNSPSEFTRETVRGKTVVFTTTNGTRAMARARQAAEVLVGAFVNAAAIVNQLSGREKVHLLCAGTCEQVTREDVLAAGLLAARLMARAGVKYDLANDEARLAIEAWRQAAAGHEDDWQAVGSKNRSVDATAWLTEIVRDSTGGRSLMRLGLAADIADAARLDRFDLVPVLDLQHWSITTV